MSGVRLVCTAVRAAPALHDGPEARGDGPAAPLAPVRWRLLSGNNRQLGLGADTFADAQTARRAAGVLARRLAEVEAELAWMGRRVGWAWTLLLHGHAEAVSGRGYERIGLARQALDRFVADFSGVVAPDAGRGGPAR